MLEIRIHFISPHSYFFFQALKTLSVLFSYRLIFWLLLFIPESSDKLYVRAEFSISLCTEDSLLNATKTAVCNLYDLY